MKTITISEQVSKRIRIDENFINSWNEAYDSMKASGEIDKAMSEIDEEALWNECFC